MDTNTVEQAVYLFKQTIRDDITFIFRDGTEVKADLDLNIGDKFITFEKQFSKI